MELILVQPEQIPVERRLRELGVLLLDCDPTGDIIATATANGDWFRAFVEGNPMVQTAVSEAAVGWSGEANPPVIDVMGGLFVVPVARLHHRRLVGYRLALVATDSLLDSEHLVAACSATQADHTLIRSRFEKLPPVANVDLERVATLARDLMYADFRTGEDRDAIESMGQRLAESYEEVSLLYSTVQLMTVGEHPERFIRLACEELLLVLNYAWIGTVLTEDVAEMTGMSSNIFAAGDVRAEWTTFRAAAEELLRVADCDRPLVLAPDEGDPLRALGATILAHPIASEGRLIGLFIAGEKQGLDSSASSADLKLLGATASHTAIFLENVRLYEDLNAMALGTLEALTAAIDAKDPYTRGHSQRVAHLTEQLAIAADLSPTDVERARIAALVHDIGKIGVPEAVLTKPGRLTADEFHQVQRHPEMGHTILKDIPGFADLLPGVLHHHERWEGGGYPHGIAGEEIPLVARLIALADSFDAMSSTRTYRARLNRADVLSEIKKGIGTQFDPVLAPIFLRLNFEEFDRMIQLHECDQDIAYADLSTEGDPE